MASPRISGSPIGSAPTVSLTGPRARIDLCPGDRDDAGQLDAVEQYEEPGCPGLRVHAGIRQELAGHLPSVVGGVASPFEAMGSELDSEGAHPVPS